ncbi:MAG: PfkB family carbohydrate kinase, partial [Pseudomonadota bacterium]
MSKRVAVFGEALIDLVDQGRASYAACPGGSPFNVALALARLGHPVAFFGPLSQDRFGQQLGAVLDQAGVDLVFNERSGKPSALAIASLVDQEPEYAFYLTDVADTDVTAAALVERWPQDLALFHTGSLALLPGRAEMTFDLLEHARRQATPVSVDLNLRMGAAGDPAAYREAVMRAASLADLVKLSAEDLDALFPALPRDAAVSALRAGMRSAMLVMTDGPRGASAWFA